MCTKGCTSRNRSTLTRSRLSYKRACVGMHKLATQTRSKNKAICKHTQRIYPPSYMYNRQEPDARAHQNRTRRLIRYRMRCRNRCAPFASLATPAAQHTA